MTHPLQILRVIASMDPRTGGPVEGIARMTDVLANRGHHTDVVCLDRRDVDWLTRTKARVHAIGPGVGKFGLSLDLVSWLRRQAHQFDCAIVHGNWQFTGLATWLTMRHGEIPYFVYPHGMLDPWFNEVDRLKHLKKIAYWTAFERQVLGRATAVLYTCEEERRLARRSFPGYCARDITVGYGTLRPDGDQEEHRQEFMRRHPALRQRRFILSLARIHPKKGHDLLIEAFAASAAQDPSVDLAIAGPDAVGWRATLEALVARHGIADRVHWLGMLSGDAKWGAMRSAELFALPSHQENFGIAVVEALACGVPVAISNRINIWKEISDDGAGFVGDDTVAGTAASLRCWMALSPDERRTMSLRALSSFATRFDVERVADRFVRILYEHTVTS